MGKAFPKTHSSHMQSRRGRAFPVISMGGIFDRPSREKVGGKGRERGHLARFKRRIKRVIPGET